MLSQGSPTNGWLVLVLGLVVLASVPVAGATHDGVQATASQDDRVHAVGSPGSIGGDRLAGPIAPGGTGPTGPIVDPIGGGQFDPHDGLVLGVGSTGPIARGDDWTGPDPRRNELAPDDYDGDGIGDVREVELGTDLTSADTDGDGLTDAAEQWRFGTDPTSSDTDGDGLVDDFEVAGSTDPGKADTDGDGLGDRRELNAGTDPRVADTDDDGLTDATELDETETDPLSADTDGDFLDDGVERAASTDPTDVLVPVTLPGVAFGAVLGALFGLSFGVPRRWLVGEVRRLSKGMTTHFGATPSVVAGARTVRSAGTAIGGLLTAVTRLSLAASQWSHDDSGREERGSGGGESLRAEGPKPDPETEEYPARRPPGGGNRGPAEDGETPADELVPDEQVVERLLHSNEGRLKQGEIVESTGWSKSKVSRLLSRMTEEGWIVKVKLGRENLICLSGWEPEIVSGPPPAPA